jgi:hypothetical protein
MDGWMDGRKEGTMDGWMDGWKGWVEGWKDACMQRYPAPTTTWTRKKDDDNDNHDDCNDCHDHQAATMPPTHGVAQEAT